MGSGWQKREAAPCWLWWWKVTMPHEEAARPKKILESKLRPPITVRPNSDNLRHAFRAVPCRYSWMRLILAAVPALAQGDLGTSIVMFHLTPHHTSSRPTIPPCSTRQTTTRSGPPLPSDNATSAGQRAREPGLSSRMASTLAQTQP